MEGTSESNGMDTMAVVRSWVSTNHSLRLQTVLFCSLSRII